VFAKNLFDERGEIGRYTECVIQVCAQTLDFQSVYVIPTRPRTIGIRFGQDF